MSNQAQSNESSAPSLSEKARRLLAAHDREVGAREHSQGYAWARQAVHMPG